MCSCQQVAGIWILSTMSDLLKAVQDSCQDAVAAIKDFSAKAPGTTLTQALVVGALTGLLAYQLMKKRYRLPPGPLALPLVGNLLWLRGESQQLYMVLQRWAREKYGPVMSIYLGPKLCVTLNDLDSITEALVQKGADFSGRPFLYSVHTMAEGSSGIALADYSPVWKLQRKIALKAIRLYMTGPHLEQVVHKVMAQVADKMAAEPGPFDPHPYTSSLMFRIIDCICFGEVKPYDDPTLQAIIDDFDDINNSIGNGFFEDILPPLRYWPTRRFRRVLDKMQHFTGYLQASIDQHRHTFTAAKPRDVTDTFLLAQREAAGQESAQVLAQLTDTHVRQTISDLFGAGVDTSRFTLDWAFLYLAGHPEMQQRAQAEIEAVTGPGQLPGLAQRGQLAYTQALLQEVMRLGTVVPLSLPHSTLRDTTIGGYQVPKDTMVMVNLWAVSHDPALWEEPYTFNPDRFLDNQGRLKPTPKAWLPFSCGQRVCLGESVARPQLLLLLACFLKRFTIALPPGVTYNPAHQTKSMVVHAPEHFKIVVTAR